MTRAPPQSIAADPLPDGTDQHRSKTFWDSHSVKLHQSIRFRLGALTLLAKRFEREWRFGWWRDRPPLASRRDIEVGPKNSRIPDDVTRARFAFRESPSRLKIVPVLADRMMIARPEVPVSLLPQERVRLYISTPLWLRIVVDDKDKSGRERELWEESVSRPSDTWFGDKTTVGEMAYASRTQARLSLDDVVWLPQRAVTEVHVSNESSGDLTLSRLSIPVRNLSIHTDDAGHLWTPSVRLSRTNDSSSADVDVRQVPKLAGRTVLIGAAREPPPSGNVIRAFAKLFSE